MRSGRLRHVMIAAVVAGVMVAAAGLAGCGARTPAGPTVIRIGTLPTEDALPLWVAQLSISKSPTGAPEPGFAQKAGIDLRIITFPSAQERDAALVAGKIDGFMGDVVAAATLADKGTPVKIVTTMLGADAAQGRFGIVVPKDSSIRTAMQLRNVPIATSSNTITEYVMERLLEAEGLAANDIKKVEVKKIPVRLELLLAGKLRAAALPDPLLFFAQQQGARLIIDDTKGQNLSQTILAFSERFLQGNPGALKRLLTADAEAVRAINADPEKYRPILVKNAKLPPPIATTYKLNVYPEPQLPTTAEVDAVLTWMNQKGLLAPGRVDYQSLIATAAATP